MTVMDCSAMTTTMVRLGQQQVLNRSASLSSQSLFELDSGVSFSKPPSLWCSGSASKKVAIGPAGVTVAQIYLSVAGTIRELSFGTPC